MKVNDKDVFSQFTESGSLKVKWGYKADHNPDSGDRRGSKPRIRRTKVQQQNPGAWSRVQAEVENPDRRVLKHKGIGELGDRLIKQ